MKPILKIEFLYLLITFLTPQLFSQQTIKWDNYNQYSRVLCMLDLDTAVLTGANHGLTCTNKGTNQVTYFNSSNSGIPSGSVQCLAKGEMGSIWIGTACGLTEYSGGNWTYYTPQNSILTSTPLALHYSNAANALFVGLGDGNVIRIDTSGWNLVLGVNIPKPTSQVRSLAADTNGNIWAATWGNGVYKYDGTDWVNFNSSNSPLSSFVFSIAFDHNGLLWAANTIQLSSYNGINWTPHFGPAPMGGISYISVDTINRVWISTWTNGLFTFDGSFHSHAVNPSLTSNQLTYHIWDKGFLWTGTYANGVDKVNLTNLGITHFTLAPGIPDQDVVDVDFEPLNDICWFAIFHNTHTGDGGIFCNYDGNTWKLFDSLNNIMTTNNISSIRRDNSNSLWIGTLDTGLYCMQGNSLTHLNLLNSSIYSDEVTALSKGISNDLLIGYRDGTIQSLQNNNFNTLIPASLVNTSINRIETEDNSIFWATTDSSGLIRSDYVNTHIYTTVNSGIPSNRIRDIKVDAMHNHWIATDAGLVKFDGIATWTIYNSSNSGLTGNDLTAVAIAGDSSIWVGIRYSGLARFDGTSWTYYDICNSPLSCNSIYFMRTSPDGRIYVGNCGGVNVITIDNITDLPLFSEPSSLTIYPNPGTDYIILGNLPENIKHAQLTIKQVDGSMVIKKQITTNADARINIQSLSPGMYFIDLQENSVNYRTKFLKIK